MIRKMITDTVCLLGLVGCCASLFGEEPTAVTGPNFRLQVAPKQLTSLTSFSAMGEIGERLARVNATIGYQIGRNQRLKLSVDQLAQKLTYDFINGKKSAWVQQIAGGFAYKYFLDGCLIDSVDVGGWYSNSSNRRLSSFVVVDGTTAQVFKRRIAGAEGWHGSIGSTIFPWDCGSLGLAVVYDHVDYRRQALEHKTVSGFGCAIDFRQRIYSSLDLIVKGDLSPVYQHVGGALNWTFPCLFGDAMAGLYGDYTHGLKGLPNDASFGVQVNLAFGDGRFVAPFYKSCCVRDKTRPQQDLLEWIADPAVMMPMVLTMADQCFPPSAAALPDVFIEDFGPYSIDVSGAFLGGGCMSVEYSAKGLPPNSFINGRTGVIFGTNFGVFSAPFQVTVMAECVCGVATSTFELTLENL